MICDWQLNLIELTAVRLVEFNDVGKFGFADQYRAAGVIVHQTAYFSVGVVHFRQIARVFVLDIGIAVRVGAGKDWIVVQAGRYRYRVLDDDLTTVQVVMSEYLACEVTWM